MCGARLRLRLRLEGLQAHRRHLRHPSPGRVCCESDRLPEPIFTPATKAESGHDENISFETAAKVSWPPDRRVVARSDSAHLRQSRRHAESRGIILADTKFEFGWNDGELLLADEVLTPDSSRFWPRRRLCPGQTAEILRQAVRARLSRNARLGQQPPAPPLPADVVEKTAEKYRRRVYRGSPAARCKLVQRGAELARLSFLSRSCSFPWL